MTLFFVSRILENKTNMFVRNVGKYSPDVAVSHSQKMWILKYKVLTFRNRASYI